MSCVPPHYTRQVSALGQQLRDSEAAAAQLQAAAASAAASGREAGEAEAARKHMKAVKWVWWPAGILCV